LLGGGFLVSIPVAVHLLRYDRALGLIVTIVLAATWLPVGFLTVPLYYVIGPDELRIRSGVRLKRIPLGTIKRVYPTRDSIASSALSLDRIKIHYGQGLWILISPVRKHEFMERLVQAAGLVREGEEWVRDAGNG
jgi:hypothetical protein